MRVFVLHRLICPDVAAHITALSRIRVRLALCRRPRSAENTVPKKNMPTSRRSVFGEHKFREMWSLRYSVEYVRFDRRRQEWMRERGGPRDDMVNQYPSFDRKRRNLLGPWHGKGPEIGDVWIFRQYCFMKNDLEDSRRASAMCTPAIADGLSRSTSAPWQASQDSTSTGYPLVLEPKMKKSNRKLTFIKPWPELPNDCQLSCNPSYVKRHAPSQLFL